jgi:hypothetical protein
VCTALKDQPAFSAHHSDASNHAFVPDCHRRLRRLPMNVIPVRILEVDDSGGPDSRSRIISSTSLITFTNQRTRFEHLGNPYIVEGVADPPNAMDSLQTVLSAPVNGLEGNIS